MADSDRRNIRSRLDQRRRCVLQMERKGMRKTVFCVTLLLLSNFLFVRIPHGSASSNEDLRVSYGLPEDVPREPLPDNYAVEEYLNTTNPYIDNMDIQGVLDEVDDPEGDNPFYVFIFGDEEERPVGRWWEGTLDWTSWIMLQLERGDESLVANYGIDIRILGFGEWDSNDNSDSMYNLWYELEAEKNYSLRTWYDGEWWSNYVDAIIGITSQSTPADDPPRAGLSPR